IARLPPIKNPLWGVSTTQASAYFCLAITSCNILIENTMNTAIHKTLWLLLIGATFISCAKTDTGEEDIRPVSGSGNELSGEVLLIEEKVNGQTLFAYEYDNRNRVVLQHITTAGSDTVHSYTYDDRDRLIAVDRKADAVFLTES